MLQVGTILHGTYKIESYLASGGFGNTYLAKNIEFDETYAIKEFFVKGVCQRDGNSTTISVSNPENTNSFEQQREKFKKEARRLRSLSNPHIVKVYDLFEENGTAYYVMEYIDGGSLSDLIEKKGSLSEEETLKYTRQIASALQYIHAHNMNHLDVKPGNVLLRQNGDVVLIDFGMSKNYDVAGEQTTSSPVGVSVGYAPIEQSRVGGLGMFSPETDIYSLGATMFKMLTGQTPPEATAVFDEGLPEMPANVSAKTKQVVEKAMQPRRKDRYLTVEDFLEALGESVSVTNAEEVGNVSVSEETQYMPPVEKVKQNASYVDKATIALTAKDLDAFNPKFLKEDDKEATAYISDNMVINSNIDSSDIVDLGLSVKWCGRNLGALTPEDNAAYFCWADGITEFGLSMIPSESDIAGSSKDIAFNMSGGKLKVPTRKQFKELIDKCRWSWCTYNGVVGSKVTGPSGRSIFLPSAGRKCDYGIFNQNTWGYYWSSSKASGTNAYYLYFNDENSDIGYESAMTMRSIRPVCDL